jgi:ribonuclease HI
MSGPVVTDAEHPEHEGAAVATNNTAELTAILWAMRVASSEGGEGAVLVRYDSTYAAKMALGQWKATRNVELIAAVQEAVQTVRKARDVYFMHIKGHSGAHGNDRADRLAARGARERVTRLVKRPAHGPEIGWAFGDNIKTKP